ncbi:MAG: hypothetical protein DMG97_05635 [Acidobacteria bacterium]|nr:MAG: hypothetical protein DMG97_05635 [Acidobacteriota bacterium]
MRVSNDFFWAEGATGTISAPPDAVTSLSGAWNEALTCQEVSALGTHTVYWIWFDELTNPGSMLMGTALTAVVKFGKVLSYPN